VWRLVSDTTPWINPIFWLQCQANLINVFAKEQKEQKGLPDPIFSDPYSQPRLRSRHVHRRRSQMPYATVGYSPFGAERHG
jgi:hypothetical protein